MVNHRINWYLRPVENNEDDDDLFNIYRQEDLFTLRIYYGGTFKLNPPREYENGQLKVIDFVSMDYFSLVDIDIIALATGYKYRSPVMYLWPNPGDILDNGLRPLQCDEHVRALLKVASWWKIMDVYLDGTPLWSIVRLTNLIPTTAYMIELEEEDSGFEIDSEDEVVVGNRGLLMIGYEPMEDDHMHEATNEVDRGENDNTEEFESGPPVELDVGQTEQLDEGGN
ncbi:hypothetical protein LIER_25051 [Lithospermum erythrorhizon]|uniref:PB1-like domain-containing protein n=1 Tax=Lithospermum erythrorhizon TaxID=34254 RepID=A0AAV3R713_LITER